METHIPRIRRVCEGYARTLRRAGAGLTYDYDLHARRAVHLALTLALAASLPVLTGDIMLALIAAAPAVASYPLLQLWSRLRRHAVQVRKEMSFFLCYLATMQGVGYTPYTVLERMRDAPDVFVAMRATRQR